MDEDQKEIVIATERLDQMLSLMYLSLPHDEAVKGGWQFNGIQFLTWFENIFTTLKANFKNHPEEFYPYMILIRDCLNYITDDTDCWPDQDGRDNGQAILNYLQSKSYTSHPDKNPINLIDEDGKIKGVINDAYFDMSKKKQ